MDNCGEAAISQTFHKAGSSERIRGGSTSSDVSDTDRDCRVNLNLNDHKSDREEGRATDDDLASCSDHISVEGSNNADETRQSPGNASTWSRVSFVLSSDPAGSQPHVANTENDQQLKLARLLLSRNKVGIHSHLVSKNVMCPPLLCMNLPRSRHATSL
jgi:hypothetical protein